MGFSLLGAISAGAGLLGAGSSIAGNILGSNAASDANATSAAVARNQLQNAINQQEYTKALNAIAMQRAIAGTTSARGDTSVYDPSTNTWKTTLTPGSLALQSASDTASIRRNTTDKTTGELANNNAVADSIRAGDVAGSALAKVRDFKPISSQGLEGLLQQTATTANRQAQDPIIAATLRQFARSGTAAGPVLTNMMRDNATSLRQTMLNDQIEAMKHVDSINNGKRAGLLSTYDTLNKAGTPQLSFPGISTSNITDLLNNEVNARATNSSTSASAGAYNNSAATNSYNNASQFAALHPKTSNIGASIGAAGQQLKGLFDPNSDVVKFIKSIGSGAGNAGDNSDVGSWGTFFGAPPQSTYARSPQEFG